MLPNNLPTSGSVVRIVFFSSDSENAVGKTMEGSLALSFILPMRCFIQV